jgi:predicted AAA+ superfamily ATPase
LLNTLSLGGKGVSTLQKPDKIYLENTNLAFALKERPDIGNVRETFVLNQLINAGIGVDSANTGDFTIDELTIQGYCILNKR